MIIGIGIDIIEVTRVRSAYERFGERFTKRILLEEEIAYCLAHKDPAPYLTARFAAKEAVSKAFGTGIGAQLGWHDIQVGRDTTGRPYIILHGEGLGLFQHLHATQISLSLSHTGSHATAIAILEGNAPG